MFKTKNRKTIEKEIKENEKRIRGKVGVVIIHITCVNRTECGLRLHIKLMFMCGKYQDKISRSGQLGRCPLTVTSAAIRHLSTVYIKSQHESAKFSLFL